MYIKLLMTSLFFLLALIPRVGLTDVGADLRIQYIHEHEHNHNHTTHEHNTEEINTTAEDNQHCEDHSHELVLSAAVSNYILVKNSLSFTSSLTNKKVYDSYEEKLPLSNNLSSIFRPPITV